MSNIENKVKTLYQPGGTTIITINVVSPRIIDSGLDPHGMGRWSYITINGRNKTFDNHKRLPCVQNSYSRKRSLQRLHTTMVLHERKGGHHN